jgi:hypothetical protein
MMFFPAARLLTGPLPPLRLAARFFAAAILPPLLFFIVRSPSLPSVHASAHGDCANEDIECQR